MFEAIGEGHKIMHEGVKPELEAENRELRERVQALEKQRDKLAYALEDFCKWHAENGDCPVFYFCPAGIYGLSCGEMANDQWIEAAEQAAKEAGE